MFVILVFQLPQELPCMDKSMPELPKDCNNKNHFFKLFFRAVWQVSCQQGHLSKVFFCIITRAARGVINIILPINTTNTFSKIPHEGR